MTFVNSKCLCCSTQIQKVGVTVILPCSTKNKTDISRDLVEWLVKDPTTGNYTDVHVYNQGEDQLHKQRDDFKDRTSLFKEELSSGDCSLSLLVTTSHNGTYCCCVPGRLCCTVTLKGTYEYSLFYYHEVCNQMHTRCFTGYKQSLSQLHDIKSDV